MAAPKLTEPQRDALQYVEANEGRAGGGCRLSRISEAIRQQLIDLAMFDTPMIWVDGDFISLAPAGRSALHERATRKDAAHE